jgi:hypothetical protein
MRSAQFGSFWLDESRERARQRAASLFFGPTSFLLANFCKGGLNGPSEEPSLFFLFYVDAMGMLVSWTQLSVAVARWTT